MYKFFLEEEMNMLTCNLSEIVHNIWLQQFWMKGTCFFFATFDDYMQTFKQSPLYYAFLQGGAFDIGLDKNETQLHKANIYGDLVQIVVIIIKYTSSSSLSTRILHLEGEKMFRLAKCNANLPLGSKENSH